MRGPGTVSLAALVFAGAGCGVTFDRPTGAEITCARAADCPVGLVCATELGRCVPAGGERIAPAFLDGPAALPPVVSRVPGFNNAVIVFQLSEPVEPVAPWLRVTVGALELAGCATTGGDTPTYRCGVDAAALPAVNDGDLPVTVSASDPQGNGASATTTLRLDLTPPAIVEGSVTLTLTPGPNNPATAVSRVTYGTALELRFSVDEELLGPPRVAASSPAALPFGVVSEAARTYVFLHLFAASPAVDGAYDVEVTATDLAGNTSSSLLAALFVVDTAPPAAPAVSGEQLRQIRAPWGDAELGPQPHHHLSAVAGLIAPGESLVAYDAPPPRGVELGRGVAGSDGQPSTPGEPAGRILLAADATEVFVASLDQAGNASPAVRVTSVEWVATLGGEAATNPHRLWQMPALTERLFGPATEITTPTEVAALDGEALAESGAAIWRQTGTADCTVSADDQLALPEARYGHALAYDAARGRVVLFGGRNGAGALLGDTWEWTGGGWARQQVFGPAPRRDHAMVYDPLRGVVLLYGGFVGPADAPGSGGAADDTWAWDGAQWTALTPSRAPLRRFGHALVWDEAAERVMLFGGEVPPIQPFGGMPIPMRDASTWAWDGADWSPLTSDERDDLPGHAMAFDRNLGAVLRLGDNETSTWDGTAWQPITTSATPPLTLEQVLVWREDESGVGQTLAFGASAMPGWVYRFTGEDWEIDYDGPPSGSPVGWLVVESAGCFDAEGNRVLLFGGRNGMTPTSGTWLSSPRSPIQDACQSAPGDGAITFHAALDVGIARAKGTTDTRTWFWRGGHWFPRAIGGPGGGGVALGYDPTRGVAVLLDGNAAVWSWATTSWAAATPAAAPASSRTLAWDGIRLLAATDTPLVVRAYDGTTWSVPPSAAGPSLGTPRAAWDPARGLVVAATGHTWEWQAGVWTQGADPDVFTDHGLCYAGDRGRVLLVGGFAQPAALDYRMTIQEWTGSAWRVVPAVDVPGAGAALNLTYDPTRRQLLVVNDARTGPGTTWPTRAFVVEYGSRRPAQRFTVDTAAAAIPSGATLDTLTARWRGGGVGYPDGVAEAGAELLVWRAGRWQSLAVEPTAAATALADLTFTTDLNVSTYLLAGRHLHLALAPKAVNGAGDASATGDASGRVVTDFVEVRLHYRLP